MILGDFHEMVDLSLGRGSAVTDLIPSFTRQAVRWMERNHTFAYMQQFVLLELDVSALDTPRYIELGPGAPKAIPFFRWVGDDGYYAKVERISPADQDFLADATAAKPPTGYWLDGIARLVLNATPTEDLSGELRLDRYTSWPVENDDFEHWLMDYAEDVLLAQTLLGLSARLRDPKLRETYKEMRDEGLHTLLRADEELQFSGQTARMEYRPSG